MIYFLIYILSINGKNFFCFDRQTHFYEFLQLNYQPVKVFSAETNSVVQTFFIIYRNLRLLLSATGGTQILIFLGAFLFHSTQGALFCVSL